MKMFKITSRQFLKQIMNREEKIEYIKKDVYLNEMWNKNEIEAVGELSDDELNEIIEEIKDYYEK